MTGVEAANGLYEAVPMDAPLDGSRAAIVSEIMRRVCAVETVFGEGQEACEARCFVDKDVREMCEACRARMALVANALLRPDTLVWEVWRHEGALPDLVGIIRFSSVRRGEDAVAHYVFFDGDLRGKTGVMRSVIEWAFTDHEEQGWAALRRLTVEIPDFAFALARHASRKLGFGGPFRFKLPEGGPALQVEGVRPKGVRWRGERRDVLVLGLENPAVS